MQALKLIFMFFFKNYAKLMKQRTNNPQKLRKYSCLKLNSEDMLAVINHFGDRLTNIIKRQMHAFFMKAIK